MAADDLARRSQGISSHGIDLFSENILIIPPAQRSCWGYIVSLCPSVCPASRVHSVAPTVLVGSIFYQAISEGVLCVKMFAKFEFLAIFLNL